MLCGAASLDFFYFKSLIFSKPLRFSFYDVSYRSVPAHPALRYQLFTKIGEKYGIVCISAAGKDNIKQRIFPMKSEKVLVIADGAAFGPQMNDIYAYDPDTEEEAGQCVDEVIQIAEESGAEIQFY